MDRSRTLIRSRALIPSLLTLLSQLGLLLVSSTARADSPCDDERPGVGTPVRVPVFGPADWGAPQETCARTRVSLDARAALLVAERDFYGTVLAGLALRATWALPASKLWVSVFAPGLEYRFVANATVEADRASLGAGALGLHVPIAEGHDFSIVTYGRLLAPTETLYANAIRYGADHGVSALYRVSSKLELVSGLGFPMTFVSTSGTVTSAIAPHFSGDVVYRPWRGLGLALGVGLRPLEALDPRAQLRFYPFRGASISLAGLFPLLGRDRTTAGISISLGYER